MPILPENDLALSSNGLFWLLAGAAGLGQGALQISLPALAAMAQDLNVSFATAQLTFSLALVAMALATLFVGPLSDKWGRRPVMVWAMGLFLIGGAVATLAPNIWGVIFGRILQGMGGVAGLVVGRAVIRDLYDDLQSAQALSYLMIGQVIGPAIAPLIGSLLLLGAGWRFIFAFTVICGLILWVLLVKHLEETRPAITSQNTKVPFIDALGMLAKSPRFWQGTLLAGVVMSMFYSIVTTASYAVSEVFNISPIAYGFLMITMAVFFVSANYISGRMVINKGPRSLVRFGSIAAMAATFVMVWMILNVGQNVFWFLVPSAMLALANGFVVSNSVALALASVPRISGTASGVVLFFQLTLAGIISQLVGYFLDGDLVPLAVSLVILSVISILVAISLPKADKT